MTSSNESMQATYDMYPEHYGNGLGHPNDYPSEHVALQDKSPEAQVRTQALLHGYFNYTSGVTVDAEPTGAGV